MHPLSDPLRAVAACLLIAAGFGVAVEAALAQSIPIERRIAHPNSASILLKTLEARSDSIVLSAIIANPTDRELRLNRGRSLVLADPARGLYRLNPPLDNPELRIPARSELAATLVFIGPPAPAAPHLGLLSNEGIGTTDNPHDDAPVFRTRLPIPDRSGGDEVQANHPNGAALLVRRVIAGANACVVSLRATNGNDRSIALNRDGSLVLSDARGGAAPIKAPAENLALVVPPGDRLDAELVFDCRTLDASGPLTLTTNRGTAGTTDNPYETLPVFALPLRAARLPDGAMAPTVSRASVAPIARSQLAPPTIVAAAVADPAPGLPPAAPIAPPVNPPPISVAPAPAPVTPPANRPSTPLPTSVPTSVPQLEAALRATKSDRGLVIVLPADKLFGPGLDTLDEAAEPLLSTLATLIATTQPRQVIVAGHTDSSGNDDENLALSERRARAVAAWLAARVPKPRPRFVESAFGRTRPVAPNHQADGSANAQGRERNRRIEIILRR